MVYSISMIFMVVLKVISILVLKFECRFIVFGFFLLCYVVLEFNSVVL